MLEAADLIMSRWPGFMSRSSQNPTGVPSCRPSTDRSDGLCVTGTAPYLDIPRSRGNCTGATTLSWFWKRLFMDSRRIEEDGGP